MLKTLSKIDWILFLSMVSLIGFGLLMLYSTSVGSGDFSFVIRQVVYSILGLAFFLVIIFLNYKNFLKLSGWFYVFVLILLIITFVIGLESRGSTRWIDFGVFRLQPSELAKPILVLLGSFFFVKLSPLKWRNIAFSLFLFIIPVIFVFTQPDFGSAMVLASIWISLVYISGIKIKDFLAVVLIAAVSLPVGFEFLKDYQRERLVSFLNPGLDPLGSGYNVVQSIIAVGSGQFFGKGFGRGTQSHLNFLPEQKTDFIFATTAEELGFLGVCLIIILFAVLFWRILKIAANAKSKSGSLVCYGALTVFLVQLFVNAGMNMGLLPVTGITLPFVSFGGSSLISMIILIGLVESVHLKG